VSYIKIGRKKTTAALDQTGLNPGNWTNVMDHAVLGVNVANFECYHLSITQLATIATLTVYVGIDIWDSVQLSGNSGWDPSQPLLLTPADDVYLCWSLAASGTPPIATAWLRYDPAVQPVTIPGSS
jgi:hypothetical protein